MRKICIVTTCRADFPYLYFIMKDIDNNPNMQLQIICPENHHNRLEIHKEFAKYGIANLRYTNPVNSIADYGTFYLDCLGNFRILKPDCVLILGDRFEMLAAASAALFLNVKICHMHAGEITAGSFDNNIRNAITVMSDICFTATEEYAEKVCEMKGLFYIGDIEVIHEYWNGNWNGKTDYSKKVYVTGSPGLDWLTRVKLLSSEELQGKVSINLKLPFAVACYHPVTRELQDTEQQITEFCNALDQIDEQILYILPNIDPQNEIIRKIVQKHADKWCLVENLDHLIYLSLLQYASLMIGNSSSGIIESASFNLPSISVGNRQDGRIKPSNVISCLCETEAILNAIDRAKTWNATVGMCDNPYGKGDSSRKIVKILEGI